MRRSFRAHIWIAGSTLATADHRGSAAALRLRLERETECAIPVEQRGRIARARAFDREQAQLGGDAAVGGEAAGLAAGGEHAMARHDERERVSSERLPDVAREGAFAEPRGDLPV